MSGEIIATIGRAIPIGGLDGTGSGFGLAQCPSCARWIDTSCSKCDAPVPQAPMSSEEVLKRREALHAEKLRERSWYDRGAR